ncbi:outer membrane porin [plant metagenome]|uniref:Outer membrane porin n=1 Tax=plant metagenome TaxID=1297885 RepID=A0A484V3I8_9ZZZZ
MYAKKSKILAGALLAGSLGASAVAQAETSVTLYGLIDAGLVYQRGKVGRTDGARPEYGGDYQSRLSTGANQQSGSRWGLRGSEDLGDGLRAIFVLESGFSPTTGRSGQRDRLFGRQATLGLAHDAYGRIDLGRQKNVASNFLKGIDPFELDFLQATAGTAFSAANSVRYDNSVLYHTPVWGGFQAAVGYSFEFDEDRTVPGAFENDEKNRAVTAGLRYASGPLEVALTYDQQFRHPSAPQPKQAILGAAYDLEVLKISAAYGYTKDGLLSGQDIDLVAGRNNPNTPARGTGTTNQDFTWKGLTVHSYLVGLSAPVGASGKVLGSYQRADPNKNLSATDVYSLGYLHDLSKRTNLYAFASYANRAAFVYGNKMTTVGVGLRHRF